MRGQRRSSDRPIVIATDLITKKTLAISWSRGCSDWTHDSCFVHRSTTPASRPARESRVAQPGDRARYVCLGEPEESEDAEPNDEIEQPHRRSEEFGR
jgi:hypothetical protein